jgi:hypothetical protein
MAYKMVWLLVLVLLAGGRGSVAGAQEDADLSGTLTLTASSVAIGIGWSWGSGHLTLLDGSEHRFKIDGLDIVAVGIKQATGVGHVYNLKKLEDFAGKYVKVAAGATVGGGVGAMSMRNDQGVVINLTSTSQGVDFRLAVSGMDVKLVQ